jgi:hypothetical protein
MSTSLTVDLGLTHTSAIVILVKKSIGLAKQTYFYPLRTGEYYYKIKDLAGKLLPVQVQI